MCLVNAFLLYAGNCKPKPADTPSWGKNVNKRRQTKGRRTACKQKRKTKRSSISSTRGCKPMPPTMLTCVICFWRVQFWGQTSGCPPLLNPPGFCPCLPANISPQETHTLRWPFGKIDGHGKWDKTHLNQCHLFLAKLT